MPAEKTNRVQQRQRTVNRMTRSQQRTMVKRAEQALAGKGDVESTLAVVAQATSALDRASRKGVIHPNNAARHKSRLALKLNRLASP